LKKKAKKWGLTRGVTYAWGLVGNSLKKEVGARRKWEKKRNSGLG